MKTNETESHSEQQARLQYESIAEMVAKLSREGAAKLFVDGLKPDELESLYDEAGIARDATDEDWNKERLVEAIDKELIDPDGFTYDEDEARQEVEQSPLSVEVRSGWYSPGDSEGQKPQEFQILLCTGGPACRIMGELNEHGEPDRAWLEHQDWGTPWQQYFKAEQDTLLAYCRCFYFGE